MIRRTLETLAAGCAVYFLMAACSGSGASHKPSPVAMAGDTGDGGHNGGGGLSGGGEPGVAGDFGMAGVLNPVAGASAQEGGSSSTCECEPYVPPEPIVVETECDNEYAGSPTMWAKASFPGKTAEELAGVVAMVTYPDDLQGEDGHNTVLSAAFVKDGSAIVSCGSVAYPATQATGVRFVLRP